MIAAAFRTLRSRNLPLSELTGLYTALWKKTYLKRWRFNRVMRFVVSHPASFPILEGLIRMGPLLKRLTPFFHHGFDSTPAHELP